MSGFNINQAEYFIELLRGNADANVCWQLFNDQDSDVEIQCFHGDLKSKLSHLQNCQRRGMGVYTTINPTNGVGREISDITSYDWAFADIDGKAIPDNFPLPPRFSTRRDSTHGHVYWPIKGCVTEAQYNRLQRTISVFFDSDDQVIDPCRVVRVPGFMHLKDPSDPKYYNIHEVNDGVEAYSLDEIYEAFVIPESEQKKITNWLSNMEALKNGTGIEENEIYTTQLRNYARDVAAPAVLGSGSKQVLKTAAYGYDRGVPLEITTAILWEYYNPRCEPPWEEHQYKQFALYCKRGYRYGKNAPGCKTAVAVFEESDPIPEPVNGWEANARLEPVEKVVEKLPFVEPPTATRFGHVTELQAAKLKIEVTNKSSVQSLAMLFIGINYPDGSLICFESTFYAFNGKHWDIKDDGLIKNEIQRTMFGWEFPPSKIQNIFVSISTILYTEGLKRGCYFGQDVQKGVSNIVVENGIVEIKNGEVSLKPHDKNLFELTAMKYPYDPDAECREFMNFLDATWPGDTDTHLLVQELYGLIVSNDNKYEKVILMTGKSRSGKGVHARVMTSLVGENNVCNPAIESLIENYTVNTMSTKKVAIIPEANEVHPAVKGRVGSRVKAISGGDSIEYDRKYKDSASCTVWPIMVIQCNEIPDFTDPSGALANRFVPLVFLRSFQGMEDRGLTDRLTSKVSMTGIFNFALKGYARLSKTQKLTQPALTLNHMDDLKYDMFPLSAFFEDCCTVGGDDKVLVDDLYQFYLLYANSNGIKTTFSKTKFGKLIQSSHLKIVKSRDYSDTGRRPYFFTGVKINELALQKYDPSAMAFNTIEQPQSIPKIPVVKNIKGG